MATKLDDITLTKKSSTLTLNTKKKYVEDDVSFGISVIEGSVTQNTPTVSETGLVTATTSTIAGFVSTDAAADSKTLQLSIKGAETYPFTTLGGATIPAGKYLTGDQVILQAYTSGVEASNIKYGTTVKVGDSQNNGRIHNVAGSFTKANTVSSGQTAATANNIISGYSAWVDGIEVKGNIESKTSADLIVNGKTITAPAGSYTEDVSASVAVGTVTSGSATITSLTKTYNSTSGKFDISGSANVSAPTVGAAGYVSSTEGTKNANTGGATVNATLNKIVGSTTITGATTKKPVISKQSTPSSVTNAASGAATTTEPSSGVYVAVKSAENTGTLTATPSVTTEGYGTAANNSISGNIATVGATASDMTYIPIATTSASVEGKTVSYGSGWINAGSKSVADGSVTPAVNSHSITTTPVVTGSLSGTVTNIGTTTKPSGTDGTDYWTITPSGSVTTTGKSTTNAKATVNAGYIATSPANSGNSVIDITPTVNAGTARYLAKASSSVSNGTASATASAGTASIAKNPSASATATANGMDGGYYTDSTTSSYYVDCSASAASGYSTATGGSASASVTASSVTVGAGYNPSSVTASTNASSTGNKTGTSATSTEVTASQNSRIYLKPAGISWSGGGLSNTTNYSGTPTVSVGIDSQTTSGIGITDTAQEDGYYVKLTGSTAKLTGSTKVTRAAYKETRTAGYLPARAETTILDSTTSSPSVTVNAASKTRYLTLPTATFANSATSGTTYTDTSATGPVLIAGDYLYINKGWTPDCKISLAKLVPDGSDVKGHGEYIVSGHSAYDNDGTLVAGTIPTLIAGDISVNGATITVPVGKYTGASGATAVTKTIDSGTVSTTFTGTGMSTYFDAGTSSNKDVTVTPKYTNTAGYVAAHSTATNNGGTAYYKIKNVSGSICGSASGGSATAAISNVNSMNTIADISGKTAGTDYWAVKATATGSAGSYTPKYTVSTAGWISSDVTGSAQTVAVSSDTAGKSIYIPKATFDKSGAGVYCKTAGYIPAGSASSPIATIGNGTVVASVSSNSAGSASMAATGFTASPSTTDYYVTLSTSAGSVKAKATGGTAGYVTSSTTNETAATSVAVNGNNTKLYIPAAAIVGSSTNATATTTVEPGTVSIANNTTSVSGKTRIDAAPATGTSGISTYYIAVKATAAANTTGTTSSISGSGSATVTTAGYAPSNLTGSVSVSGTATAKTSAKDSSVYYIPLASAAISASGTASATTTVAPGTVSVAKQSTPSGVTNAASGDATTTAPSSGVYVAVKATAAANTTGTTSSISGTASATCGTAGWAATTLTGSGSVTGTATAKTSAKDSSVTYVPITTATPAFKGGAVSGTATASSSAASLSTSTNNSGITIAAAASATRAVVQYNTAVNGWVSKAASADAYAASGATALTGTTYYLNGVTLTAPTSGTRSFSITVPNGSSTATFVFNVDTSGNVTITES